MKRNWLTSLIVVSIGFQLVCSVAEAKPDPPREPKGIYTVFLHAQTIQMAQEVAYPNTNPLPPYPNPALKTDPTDGVLVSYFCVLLSNTSTSGIAPLIGWSDLNPTAPPGVPTWNYLDDVFQAVSIWNSGNPQTGPKAANPPQPNCGNSANPPKTVQLIVSPGIQSPQWLFDKMTSCDGLFMLLVACRGESVTAVATPKGQKQVYAWRVPAIWTDLLPESHTNYLSAKGH
jgi:hypothetical protein